MTVCSQIVSIKATERSPTHAATPFPGKNQKIKKSKNQKKEQNNKM